MPPDRETYSLERLDALGRELQPVQHILDEAGLCVYATGSYGRLEAWSGSDVDLFFLQAADDGAFPFTKLVRVMARVIDAAATLDFPPFTDDGRYLEVQSVAQVENVLGSPDDDSLNAFTARLLLLLESRAVSDPETYAGLVRRVLSFYYRDFDDHPDDFVPTFLLNDVLRFWRTMTLNYEHGRLGLRHLSGAEEQREKAKSALKNYKLKFSRLTTCFSFAMHLGASSAPVTPDDVFALTQQSPRQRLLSLADAHGDARPIVNELLDGYEQFLVHVQRDKMELLSELQDREARNELLGEARRYGDRMYDLLITVCRPERLRFFVI